MASFVPPKKNDANGYTFYVSLAPRTANGTWQANPTLASGDVKIAIDDGAPANLTTLPVVDADYTKRVKVVLSQAETNGDNLTIIFSDAAGAEWCDLTVNLQTAAQTLDEMDTILDAILVDTGTTLQAELDGIQADTEDIQSRLPAALVSGRMDSSVGAMAANTLTASALATDAVTEIQSGLSTHSAADVWSVATRVLTANTNLNDPTAAAVATAVRSELATELARIDAAISSRLASASYTAPDNTSITAIKAKTDSLTFTVAGQVDANIQSVNDVTVNGVGTAGNPWGP
jgi:hypothetical protein